MKQGIFEHGAIDLRKINPLDYMSASKIKLIMKSERDFVARYILKMKKPETPAMMFGRAFHEMLLHGNKSNVKLKPSLSGKGSRTALKEWEESLPKDSLVIKQEDHDTLIHMITSLKSNEVVNGMLKNGVIEPTFVARDPKTGLDLLGMPDIICANNTIVDFKTVTELSMSQFSKSIHTFGYNVQATLYCKILEIITGKPAKFVFVAVEKNPPYNHAIFKCGEETIDSSAKFIDKGLKLIETKIDRFREDLKKHRGKPMNEFAKATVLSKYSSLFQGEIEYINMPIWAMSEMEVF